MMIAPILRTYFLPIKDLLKFAPFIPQKNILFCG